MIPKVFIYPNDLSVAEKYREQGVPVVTYENRRDAWRALEAWVHEHPKFHPEHPHPWTFLVEALPDGTVWSWEVPVYLDPDAGLYRTRQNERAEKNAFRLGSFLP